VATEYETLQITVALDDNASGPLNVLRTNLQQLADIPQRTPRGGGEHLDPAIRKTAEYLKGVLALGRGFEVLKTFMNPVSLGVAAIGYEFYRGMQALKDYTEELSNMALVAKQAGISFGELRNITLQLEASGIAVDKITASVQGLNNTIASLQRPFSQLRVDLIENAGVAGAAGMEEFIEKLTSATDETQRFNVAMQGARTVYENARAEGQSELTARQTEMKFMHDIGMDPALIKREKDLAQMTKEQHARYDQLGKYAEDFHSKWGEIHRQLSLSKDILASEALSPGGPFMQLTQLLLDTTQAIEQTWEDIDTQINAIKLPGWMQALFSQHPYQAAAKGLFGVEHAPTVNELLGQPGAQANEDPLTYMNRLLGAGAGKLRGLIPGLAEGGIINEPTLAMLGEGGPEMVSPLAGSFAGSILASNNKDNADATDENTSTINELTAVLQQWTDAMGLGGGGSSGGGGATGSWGDGGTTGPTGTDGTGTTGGDGSGQVGTKGTGGVTQGIAGGPETKGSFRPYNAAVPGGLGKEVANRYSPKGTPVDTRAASQVTLSNNVKFLTNSANVPQVTGFLNELIAEGAPITSAASYGKRASNASAHPHGLATDVNQSGRGVLNNPAFGKWIQTHQEQINQAEIRWNQVGGEHWKSPDTGHWTMGRQMSQDELTAAGKSSKEAIDKSKVAKMAEGGIVTSPTMALIGEGGPEMVIPMGTHGAQVAARERATMARLQASGAYNNFFSEAFKPVESRMDDIAQTYKDSAQRGYLGRQIGSAKLAMQAGLLPFDVASGLVNATGGAAVTGVANVLGGDMSRETGNRIANLAVAATQVPKLVHGAVTGIGELIENAPNLISAGRAALPALGRAALGAGKNINKIIQDVKLNPLPETQLPGETATAEPLSFEGFEATDRSLVGRSATPRSFGRGGGTIKVTHGTEPTPAPRVPVFDGFQLEGQTQMANASHGPALNHKLSPVEVRGVTHLAQ
jgi:hypothetical protein